MGGYDYITNAIIESKPVNSLLVPVDVSMEKALVELLTQHGAVCERKGDYPSTEIKAALYSIQFPSGSLKHDGLMLYTTQGFSIEFPDSFQLHGVHRFGRGVVEDIIVLSLPPE